MMIELMVIGGISLGFFCLLIWVARKQLTPRDAGESNARLPVEFLIPRKADEINEAHETLAKIHAEIEQGRIAATEKRRLLNERNRLARELLSAIHEDFVRLDRLMCAVAAVSPEVSREKEFERLWLSLRFGARYWMALFYISLGALPVESIAGLQILAKDKAEILGTLLRSVDSTLAANFGKSHIQEEY